jgi:hypothetical protein
MMGCISPQRIAASILMFSVIGAHPATKGQSILANLIRGWAQNIAKAIGL